MARRPHQLGALDPQLHQALDLLAGVVGVVVVAAVGEGAPDLLARIAVRCGRQERLGRRTRRRKQEGTRLSRGARGSRRRAALIGRQALHLGLAQEDVIGLLVGQQLLAEGHAQIRQFLVDGRHTRAGIRRERSARAHEALVGLLEQARLFGRQAEIRARLVERVHALEQVLVEHHLVRETRQFRRHVLLDRLVGRRRVGRGHGEEGARHPGQLPPRPLHRFDRVLERRRRRVVGDALALRACLGDGQIECRLVMLRADAVVRRHAIGRVPRRGQRIGALLCAGFGALRRARQTGGQKRRRDRGGQKTRT